MVEIIKENGDVHRFLLKSEDGYVLLRSVQFSGKAEAEKIAQHLCTEGHTQHTFERKTNHEGKFLFYLKNKEGTVIGQSQLYSSEAGMENGIKNLKNRIAMLRGIEPL